MARQTSENPGDSSSETLPIMLSGALGLSALAIAVVAAVTSQPALGLVAGVIAVVLAATVALVMRAKRDLTVALHASQTDNIRLEGALSERVKQQVQEPDPGTPVTDPPTTNTAPAVAPSAGFGRRASDSRPEPEPQAGALPSPSFETNLTDTETGLLGEQYFLVTLDGRVAAARRHLRPLSLILLDVFQGPDRSQPNAADPMAVAEIVTHTLRDADTVCRTDAGRFAIILEDTPENGAIWTVERIRRKVNEVLVDTTVWAGVACYPAHGFDAPEVLTQSRKALEAARDWQQDRTEVADG